MENIIENRFLSLKKTLTKNVIGPCINVFTLNREKYEKHNRKPFFLKKKKKKIYIYKMRLY